MANKLVERFFGSVTIHGIEVDSDGNTAGWGTFLESHPYETYAGAVSYLEKHSDVKGFEYGTVEKKFITVEKEKELLGREEEIHPEVFKDDKSSN